MTEGQSKLLAWNLFATLVIVIPLLASRLWLALGIPIGIWVGWGWWHNWAKL